MEDGSSTSAASLVVDSVALRGGLASAGEEWTTRGDGPADVWDGEVTAGRDC